MINVNIDIPLEEIHAFCEKYPIRRLSLFGSVITDHFRPDSDIDVLVEFEADSQVTYIDMGKMELELSEIFGRKVDLREPEELSRYFRQKVVDGAGLLYERV